MMITTPLKATEADGSAPVTNPAAVRHPPMGTEQTGTGTGMPPGDIREAGGTWIPGITTHRQTGSPSGADQTPWEAMIYMDTILLGTTGELGVPAVSRLAAWVPCGRVSREQGRRGMGGGDGDQ